MEVKVYDYLIVSGVLGNMNAKLEKSERDI